jgi:hypothetical protein
MKVYSYFLESISISIGNVALFDTFRFPYTLCYPRFCPGRSAFLTDRVVLFALDRAIQLSSLPLFISNRYLLISKMVASQRMKVANEKASKYVTMRGNVPKSSVSQNLLFFSLCIIVYTLVTRLKLRFIRKCIDLNISMTSIVLLSDGSIQQFIWPNIFMYATAEKIF